MKREESIKWMKSEQGRIDLEYDTQENRDRYEAYDMAIDALSDKRKRDIENAVIDRVLEIIDKAQTYKMEVGSTDLYVDREALKEDVLDLKGDEE